MSYIIIYISILLFFLIFLCKRNNWKLRISVFLMLFLSVSGVISLLYYLIAHGVFRDYSNLTLRPFLFLVLGYLITLKPILNYDLGCFSLLVSKRQEKIIDGLTVFLILCSIIPFIESISILPFILNQSDSVSQMYDLRAMGRDVEYLSFIGRKLFRICSLSELIIPILLFFNLGRTVTNKYMTIGLIFIILTLWLHSLGLGGRSKLVQNILYIAVVYFVMNRFLSHKRNKKILKWGLFIVGIGITFVLIVSISRFKNMDTNINNIWTWLGLYAGEGPLNFNSLMWDINQNTGGAQTFILLKYILGLVPDKSVSYLWEVGGAVGIPGNIFYTYIGSIYLDFNKIGTLLFLIFFSFIAVRITKNKGEYISFCKVIVICLIARILSIPTFYTYSTFESQVNLIFALLFCLLLYLNSSSIKMRT